MLSLLRTAFATVLVASALPASALTPVATPPQDSGQMIVVTTDGWDATQGRLQAYARTAQGWQPHGTAFDVAVGRNGSAWGVGVLPAPFGGGPQQPGDPVKQEGDGRSPAGVFAIGPAFGYAPKIASALPYQPMLESSYCMDVPDSKYYNRIVDAEVVGAEAVEGSTEPMRLDLHNKGDVRYREGFVIEHNPGATPGRGSCIFAHLWRTPGEATAGCTAMQPEHMHDLLAWLEPAQRPLFVLLPRAQYLRLQQEWQLPALAEAAR
ncbi:MAG: L,D-transpeptidase family protein [Stenotrophomonas sp.]|uniref:L,D-transpeptidase family protein n=1 Tax=Stenotrophomonas sp. TaxID=69392 RepID=UPI003D6D6B5D